MNILFLFGNDHKYGDSPNEKRTPYPHTLQRQVEDVWHEPLDDSKSHSQLTLVDSIVLPPRHATDESSSSAGPPVKVNRLTSAHGHKPWHGLFTTNSVNRLSHALCRYQKEATLLGTIMWGPDAENVEIGSEAERATQQFRFSYEEREIIGENLLTCMGNVWRWNAAQLFRTRSMGIISQLLHLSDDDLDDRGPRDSFLKAITLFQILWQLIEVSVRLTEGLAIAPLEILALALAVCAMITSICLWHKPQYAGTTIRFQAHRRASPVDMIELSTHGDMPGEGPLTHGPIGQLFCDGGIKPCGPDKIYYMGGVLLGSAVFALLHFISWNHIFPTAVERMLWRISAVVSLVAPWVAAGLYALTYGAGMPTGNKTRWGIAPVLRLWADIQ